MPTRRYLVAISAALLSIAATKSSQAGGSRSAGEQWVVGFVMSTTEDAITIDAHHIGTVQLKVDPSTKVTLSGESTSMSQLKPGSPVMAAYEGTGSDRTAVVIEANRARSKPSGDSRK